MPPPGAVVAGKYRIEAEIGRGGMGVVYRAVLVRSGTPVALKMLLPDGADAEGRARFAREMQLAARLSHPNSVRVLDAGHAEDGAPYLCCELLNGRTLAAVIKAEGRLPLERVVRIGVQVLDALTEAHALGIVHRDIKPANIFLCYDPPDFVKVLDFGVAKRPDSHTAAPLTAAGVGIGTPQYMAPEQVGGLTVGPATDLYALGLVLAEALDGQMVVRGSSLQDIFLAQASPIPVPLPPQVMASPLGPIVARAIEKEVTSRFTSANEMRHALDPTGATLPRGAAASPRRAGGGVAQLLIAVAAVAAFALSALAVVIALASRNAGSREDEASRSEEETTREDDPDPEPKPAPKKKKKSGPSEGRIDLPMRKLTSDAIQKAIEREGYTAPQVSPVGSAFVWNLQRDGDYVGTATFYDMDAMSAGFAAEDCASSGATYAVDAGRVLCVTFDPDESGDERALFDAIAALTR
jgi:serine/threonine protein kinase